LSQYPTGRPFIARLAPVLWLMALPEAALAQQMERPPDFSQSAVASASDDVSQAWNAWQAADQNLEQQVFSLPMADARVRIQTAFSAFVAFAEKRHVYSEAVATAIGAMAPDIAETGRVVGVDAVNADEIALLGVNVAAVQRKLDTLRSAPAWSRIRRSVQKDLDNVLDLEQARRQDLQIERPLEHANAPARPVEATAYRNSERRVQEALTSLWTHYYQALADSMEQTPGRSTPLAASATVPAPAPPSSPAGSPANSALAGTWTYVEGSRQFNGVAEPRHVILELWMEKDALVGRYRAELPDFEGSRAVDLSLRGIPGTGSTVLDFHSTSPEAAGKIILEGPNNNGRDLMLIRSVEGTPIPRGRELLTRH